MAQSGLKLNHFQERRSGPGEGRHRGPGPEMMEHMARVLGLSEDQKTQIKALMDNNGPAEEARHQKMEEIQKQLEAATANGQFDEAKVRDLANQQAQLQAEGIVEHERMKSKVFALLTAEQRVKAQEMHKRWAITLVMQVRLRRERRVQTTTSVRQTVRSGCSSVGARW